MSARLGGPDGANDAWMQAVALPAAEPLLLNTLRIRTFRGGGALTNATGFFFERGERLFLVTSRHVLCDAPTRHFPDWIEATVHTDAANLAHVETLSLPLYAGGQAAWRQGHDAAGAVDVAVLEVPLDVQRRSRTLFHAFGVAHLRPPAGAVRIGEPVLLPGFPLGFHDTLHHLPVVRQAIVASTFGLRFQGDGYFLTDARTHRGSSGAPVVMPARGLASPMRWWLLGVHSARMDMGGRDLAQDESLGLNCAWYADILLSLTAEGGAGD